MPDRNRERHGHFFSEDTGEFSVVTSVNTWHEGPDDDGNEVWFPEILITLTDRKQLPMIRVLSPSGRTYELNLDD